MMYALFSTPNDPMFINGVPPHHSRQEAFQASNSSQDSDTKISGPIGSGSDTKWLQANENNIKNTSTQTAPTSNVLNGTIDNNYRSEYEQNVEQVRKISGTDEFQTGETSPLPKLCEEKQPTFCKVCGDVVLQGNVNVPACVACHAFFKRQKKTKKEPKCPYEDPCVITVVSRKFCKKCRLIKCLEIGMKLDDVTNNLKPPRNGSVKKRKVDESSKDGTIGKRASKANNVKALITKQTGAVDVTNGAFKISRSEYFNLIYTKIGELISTQAEWHRVPQLSATEMATDESALQLFAHGMDCVVKQFRRLNALRMLSLADQRVLLKTSSHDLFVMHTAMRYHADTEMLEVEGVGYIGQDYFKKIREDRFNHFIRFISTFAGRWRTNNALLLLSAVMLFNPNNAEITSKGAVAEQQDMYRQLLKQFLELTYEEEEARQGYAYLISEADRLNDWVKKNGAEVVFELSPYTLNLVYIDLVKLQSVRD